MSDTADLDGNPRIWAGRTTKPSLTVDMGAHEYGSFPFKVVGFLDDSGEAEITWISRPGDTYTIQSCSGVMAAEWIEEETVPSVGQTTSWSDPAAISNSKFYRIGIK